jgi:hypothetical protein
MNTKQSVTTCRWATPTLFLDAPYWFEAETFPWTCTRDVPLRVLGTTARCARCRRWEAQPAEAPAEAQSDCLAPMASDR